MSERVSDPGAQTGEFGGTPAPGRGDSCDLAATDVQQLKFSGPVGDQPTASTPHGTVVTGGDIPGTPEAGRSREKHLRWLGKAEHWGAWVRFSDTEIAPPETVWMLRHDSGKVRFYAVGEGQVGPEHRDVVAATCWALANRYVDPDPAVIGLSLAARQQVLAGLGDGPIKEAACG